MPSDLPSSQLLWDVVEEHFDEACFRMEQFEARLDSPVLKLRDLGRYPEELLLAHVDALLVAGADAEREILVPALMGASAEESAPGVIAAWVMLEAGHFEALLSALEQAPAAWPAVAQAVRLAGHRHLDAWLTGLLHQDAKRDDAARAGLLECAAARRVAPPIVLEALQSEDPSLVRAATRALLHSEHDVYRPIVVDLLRHADPGVREAALIAGLRLGLPHTWATCEEWAYDAAQPCPPATALCAALGGRKQHDRLYDLRLVPGARKSVLFALGFSGNAEMIGPLVQDLESKDPAEAKLAVQALALIVGFQPSDDAFVLPSGAPREAAAAPPPAEKDAEDQASLPALEQDDLDADLVPAPEDSLPEPNLPAIREHCLQRQRELESSGSKRVLWGAPFSSERVAHVFLHGPLRVRHMLATSFGLRSDGLWYDTRRLSSAQRAQLAATSEARLVRFLGW
ncbi:MAG: hypothetical protein QM778_21590 [Myxococcales bacterium]